MDRLADFREVYARVVTARAGRGDDQPLLRAFATVERHAFLGDGPWIVREDGTTTGAADPALVYQDIGFGLAPGIPTGLPSLHAAMLGAAGIARGASVMHVGAGTGYYTAILAELVGSSGRVHAYELEPALGERARARLARWPWVSVEVGSGIRRAPAVVELVYVNAGVQQIPRVWIEALAPGGALVVPLVPGDGAGAVFCIRREPQGFHARRVAAARFVPCIGADDAQASRRLADAFARDDGAPVRSFRVHPELPDASAWLAGDGWWLSTAATPGGGAGASAR